MPSSRETAGFDKSGNHALEFGDEAYSGDGTGAPTDCGLNEKDIRLLGIRFTRDLAETGTRGSSRPRSSITSSSAAANRVVLI